MSELISRNGKKYFTLDYGNLTEKGLAKLIREFNKGEQKITDVAATNRQRRVDGQPTKTAKFYFTGAQTVSILVGFDGDVIQTKLNGTVIPVAKMDSERNFAAEVLSKLEGNQLKFEKSLARKLKKVDKEEADTKPAARSIKKRLQEAKAAYDAARDNTDTLKETLAEQAKAVDSSRSELATVTAAIKQEEATQSTLAEQIKALGGEV